MEESPLPDAKLVELSLENSDNFVLLINRYKAPIARYIKRRSHATAHDIDDILQEVFIKVYRNLNDYDKTLSFSSWIYRITHNHLIDWYRKQKNKNTVSLDDEESSILGTLAGDLNADTMSNTNDTVNDVSNALDTLSPMYKDVIMLRFFEDKTYDEISDIMQIPVSAVGVRINRAKSILRKKLKLAHTGTETLLEKNI